MAKKGQKLSHTNDGRKVFKPKNFTGYKIKGWVEVRYKSVRIDSGYMVILKLHNGEDITVQKNRSIIQKRMKRIYIEPSYYETTHKRFVEKKEENIEEFD